MARGDCGCKVETLWHWQILCTRIDRLSLRMIRCWRFVFDMKFFPFSNDSFQVPVVHDGLFALDHSFGLFYEMDEFFD